MTTQPQLLDLVLFLFREWFSIVVFPIFLVLSIVGYRIVRGTAWHMHTTWLGWSIAENGIATCSEVVSHARFLTGIHLPLVVYQLNSIAFDVSDLLGIVSLCLLVRTLKQMVGERSK